ncbi:AAA family ATPase [Longispora sp. NPDC051575]|uniref:AAA family ATPase n=1 Tax=Longispora sp. NPDC051575 TaxID=3154943 RepID=UPI0034412131
MTSPANPAYTATGLPKLGAGQLRAQIENVIASQPDKQWSPFEIFAELKGRSQAAIRNALNRLVRLGRATTVAGKYQFNPTGTPAQAPTPNPYQVVSSSGPVLRPNGTAYYPRDLAGRRDVDVLRQLRQAVIPVLLYGPPGTGKTSLIEAAYGNDLYTIAGDSDTTVGDLVGDYVPGGAAGAYDFIDGPLTQAMETGGVFFLDDATLVSPKVLAAVYPAMDGRRQIAIKGNGGRIVRAEPGFFCVGGHNPGVHGAVLSEALASRFTVQLEVTTDYDLAARQLQVHRGLVAASRELWAKVVAGEIGWAPQLRELLGAKAVEKALGLDIAVANLIGAAPEEDRDEVTKAFKKHLPNIDPTPLTLGKQL